MEAIILISVPLLLWQNQLKTTEKEREKNLNDW